MAEPRYEMLSTDLSPVSDEVAVLYFDDGNPVREHFVCYRVAGPERQPRYAVAHIAAEDTDFYDYLGAPPSERGLEEYGVYRVHDSDRVAGYDQHHIILCLSGKTIEFTGLSFGIRGPTEGRSALAVLLEHVRASRPSG